jgi:hypothetical protein
MAEGKSNIVMRGIKTFEGWVEIPIGFVINGLIVETLKTLSNKLLDAAGFLTTKGAAWIATFSMILAITLGPVKYGYNHFFGDKQKGIFASLWEGGIFGVQRGKEGVQGFLTVTGIGVKANTEAIETGKNTVPDIIRKIKEPLPEPGQQTPPQQQQKNDIHSLLNQDSKRRPANTNSSFDDSTKENTRQFLSMMPKNAVFKSNGKVNAKGNQPSLRNNQVFAQGR